MRNATFSLLANTSMGYAFRDNLGLNILTKAILTQSVDTDLTTVQWSGKDWASAAPTEKRERKKEFLLLIFMLRQLRTLLNIHLTFKFKVGRVLLCTCDCVQVFNKYSVLRTQEGQTLVQRWHLFCYFASMQKNVYLGNKKSITQILKCTIHNY